MLLSAGRRYVLTERQQTARDASPLLHGANCPDGRAERSNGPVSRHAFADMGLDLVGLLVGKSSKVRREI
jgi:hypothetical protein